MKRAAGFLIIFGLFFSGCASSQNQTNVGPRGAVVENNDGVNLDAEANGVVRELRKPRTPRKPRKPIGPKGPSKSGPIERPEKPTRPDKPERPEKPERPDRPEGVEEEGD